MKVQINKEEWIKYADAIGDFNPIHRELEGARKYGLDDIIAPGMYVASFVQRLGNFKSIDLKFVESARDREILNIPEGQECFQIASNGKAICKIGLNKNLNLEKLKIPEKFDYIYTTKITNENILNFLKSIGYYGYNKNPLMYLASLSAVALLNYGNSIGKLRIHLKQSAEIYSQYEGGEIKIKMKKTKEKEGIEMWDLFWG